MRLFALFVWCGVVLVQAQQSTPPRTSLSTLSGDSSLPSSSPFTAPLVCRHGGALISRLAQGSDILEFECACKEGWSGQSCEYRDFCAVSNPCQHGSCLNTLDGVLCRCLDGWIGLECAQVSPCSASSCIHGRCVVTEELVAEAGPTRKGDKDAAQGRLIGGATNAECECETGWGGANCTDLHADQCAAIEPCTIFNAQAASTPGSALKCGCQAALAQQCEWCLEGGVAFAPGVGGSVETSCLAPVDRAVHCPPPAAQAIRQCAVMDGTSFGWCQLKSGFGYADDGNPSSPAVGARKCHHWVWSAVGCKADWTTGLTSSVAEADTSRAAREAPMDHRSKPTAAQCSAVPPCFDSGTAGSALCGCQAAMSIGCDWCLEQQLASAPASSSIKNTCRALATDAKQCPSQQAQTVHECAAVGGLPFGWCAIDEAEPRMGYSLDGTARGPSSNPGQCRSWVFHAALCPASSSDEDGELDMASLTTSAAFSLAGGQSLAPTHPGEPRHGLDLSVLTLGVVALALLCLCAFNSPCIGWCCPCRERRQVLDEPDHRYDEILQQPDQTCA